MVATIRALAQQALAGQTLRMAVFDPGAIPGVPELWLANLAAPVSAADALTVYNFLADPSRKPVGNYPVRVYPATALALPLAGNLYLDGTNPAALANAAARVDNYQATLDIGQPIHVSRLVDVVIADAAEGVIGCVFPAYETTEIITPGRTDVVDFIPAFNPIGP